MSWLVPTLQSPLGFFGTIWGIPCTVSPTASLLSSKLRSCGELVLGTLLEKSLVLPAPGSEHICHHCLPQEQAQAAQTYGKVFFTCKDLTSCLFYIQRFNLCWRKPWTWAWWGPPRCQPALSSDAPLAFHIITPMLFQSQTHSDLWLLPDGIRIWSCVFLTVFPTVFKFGSLSFFPLQIREADVNKFNMICVIILDVL